jgi:hypothetical protein
VLVTVSQANTNTQQSAEADAAPATSPVRPSPKKRGRPPKLPDAASPVASRPSAIAPSAASDSPLVAPRVWSFVVSPGAPEGNGASAALRPRGAAALQSRSRRRRSSLRPARMHALARLIVHRPPQSSTSSPLSAQRFPQLLPLLPLWRLRVALFHFCRPPLVPVVRMHRLPVPLVLLSALLQVFYLPQASPVRLCQLHVAPMYPLLMPPVPLCRLLVALLLLTVTPARLPR